MLVNPFTGMIINAWSDEARAAAIEARKRKARLKGTKAADPITGKPIRAFHGTDSKVPFNLEDMRDNVAIPSSEGIYFTADPDEASMYAGIREGARIYPAYLNFKKPKIVSKDKFGNFRRGTLAAEGYDSAISDDYKQFLALRADQLEKGY